MKFPSQTRFFCNGIFIILLVFSFCTGILIIFQFLRSFGSFKFQLQLSTCVHDNHSLDHPQPQPHQNPQHFLYPNSWRLLNLTVKYLVNNDICAPNHFNSCQNSSTEISMIILILSRPQSSHWRQIMRETVTSCDLAEINMRRVFVLARPKLQTENQESRKLSTETAEENEKMDKLLEENEKHGDLIILDFDDTYLNLTYKTLGGLDWVTKFCENAHYILKQDDDTIVDYFQLNYFFNYRNNNRKNNQIPQNQHLPMKFESSQQKILNLKRDSIEAKWSEWFHQKSRSNDPRFVLGSKVYLPRAVRYPKSKFYVSNSTYSSYFYPQYVNGPAYITTVPAARDLVRASTTGPFFQFEDVFVTGILRMKAGIQIVAFNEFVAWSSRELSCCKSTEQDQTKLKNGKMKEDGPFWCFFLVGITQSLDKGLFKSFHTHAKYCHDYGFCARKLPMENYSDGNCVNSFVN